MYESTDDVLLETDDKMEKAIAHLQQGLSGLRTGKATPSLVDYLMVECYGTQTRLNQMSLISTPEPRLIVIKPYDPSSLPAIEKAILAANIGVTPLNDGRIIRVPIPELSEERRRDLTKVANRMGEEARVAIRAVRREANDAVKALEKAAKISEDDRDRTLNEVQKYTDNSVKKVDDLVAAKEKDIMAV
ncbi:MAG TPA: ribosome recycling factor [Kiritimatiellia bacterium]|jgi:ribosome recycling factor|nr:ribosome recycling factor [Kiritimatiellia bacterium]HOE37503.1 ribosome recycling factor [Kiritimatiellia bacterium]HOR73949.1 ribosome recycling factor [Kiritimatiellia bacterium]HOU58648.1 ribosome recycling factor [Kiritimatiellia bacterium]HPK68944.1 ribosome recycling factor [Kiritimatiellia bacterium]